MKTLFIIFINTAFLCSFGQESNTNNWRLFPNKKENSIQQINNIDLDSSKKELNFSAIPGKITVFKPSEIDSLTKKIKSSPYLLGYTLQLEVSQQTSKIRDARYKLLKISPNATIEEKYLAPNTYLYGGAFYSRADAYEFKNTIKDLFPNAIVIAKKMPLPPIETKE